MPLTLQELEHMTLENVIGRRDLGRARLATPAEIAALSGTVGEGPARGILEEWRLVAIDLVHRPPGFMLLASMDGQTWGTSLVRALDLDAGRARTRSGSIYMLVQAGQGEPPLEHVLHFCFMLHAWGVGPILAVPEVWYR
ncbi:MAG: hypothetical protein RBS99_13380 [Rhodospirillales bacterium]|nr:hypothetical protein [Rhodospirillales bacterium]